MGDLVRWSDETDEVIRWTSRWRPPTSPPRGGAVVTAVTPGLGHRQRDTGVSGFTTSLGLGRKQERIIDDPQVALTQRSTSGTD